MGAQKQPKNLQKNVNNRQPRWPNLRYNLYYNLSKLRYILSGTNVEKYNEEV